MRRPASAISRGFAYAARLGQAQSRRSQKFLAMENELGNVNNRLNTTYPNSKEEDKAILDAGIEIDERVREPN